MTSNSECGRSSERTERKRSHGYFN